MEREKWFVGNCITIIKVSSFQNIDIKITKRSFCIRDADIVHQGIITLLCVVISLLSYLWLRLKAHVH